MLDERVQVVATKYGLDKSDFWELPQKKGTWIIKHAALEVVAAKAKIVFDMPVVLEAKSDEGTAAVCVRGEFDGRSVWSIGEASPKNCKNAYPWAICEKRAIDRVILKLIGIHGLVYSEDEADDFKPHAAPTPPTGQQYVDAEPVKSSPKAIMRPIDGEMRKEIEACSTVEELNILWRSKPFQTEYDKLPKDWKEALVEFMADTKATLLKSPPNTTYHAPHFDGGN